VPADVKELLQQGKVQETIQSLAQYLRGHPADTAARTFLFELLCFAGEYARAEKQLAVLASGSPEKETGSVVYYAALHAEKDRHALFENENFPESAPASGPGELNGKPFDDLCDANPAIGARLEVFAAGAYLWLPFVHIDSLEMDAPKRLRDTLWAPALVRAAASFAERDLGEVLLPAVYPFSWQLEDAEDLWLGRSTEAFRDEGGREVWAGQKTLLVDGAELPFLEVRSLRFFHPVAAPDATR